jgi:peroxiredoxin
MGVLQVQSVLTPILTGIVLLNLALLLLTLRVVLRLAETHDRLQRRVDHIEFGVLRAVLNGVEDLSRRTVDMDPDARPDRLPRPAGQALKLGRPVAESRLRRDGLRPGELAPTFRLQTLAGAEITLEHYRGRKLLLVFTDPGCHPCDDMIPTLKRLYSDFLPTSAIVMVSRGSIEDNLRKQAEHGISFPVVIQRGWSLSREYALFGTPVAYLIDEKGFVEKPPAIGAQQVLTLARDLSNALTIEHARTN